MSQLAFDFYCKIEDEQPTLQEQEPMSNSIMPEPEPEDPTQLWFEFVRDCDEVQEKQERRN